MSIRAQSADGVIHEFPDGTPDSVIDGAMAAYAKENAPKPAKKPAKGFLETAADVGKGFVSGLDKGVAAVGDAIVSASPVGMVDQGLKTAANIAGALRGDRPSMTAPVSVLSDRAAKRAYTPQTRLGGYAKAVGEMAPAAAAPGSLSARVANVVVPAVASEFAGQTAHDMGAGPKTEAAARIAGGIVGGGLASIRMTRAGRGPAATVGSRATQDPAMMTQRAQEYRDVGIQPTFVDVVDDAGRGQIRAAANRLTEGRTVANDFAASRALDLPSRISGQARMVMSQDARTPDEIRAAMAAQRTANANEAFGAVRGDHVDLGTEGLDTLRIPEVVDAIVEAMRRERDPTVRAALENLGTWAAGEHATGMAPPITVGMADRISRVLLSKARATADNDLRATLTQFGEAIRQPAREASPGYATALEGYGADSRLHAAAGVGEGLMTRNTDEFVGNARSLGDDERNLALAAGRRAIERKAGENISSAPTVARTLADAPEQQTRNVALMGQERAQRLQQGMRLEARALDNARMVQPKAGSGTHLNDVDASRLAGVVETGHRVIRQDWIGLGMDWLRSRGVSDGEAEAIVRMATDPAQTDAAIAQVAQRLGRREADRFRLLRNTATAGALASGPAAASEDRQ